MKRIGLIVAATSVVALGATGCGGSSHNESSASVCQKLKTDSQSLQSSSFSPSDRSGFATQLKNLASKLNDDAKNASSSELRDGVSKATSAMTKVASELSSGTTPSSTELTQIESELKSAGTELEGVCPGS